MPLPMTTGISAFPLTPIDEHGIDEVAFRSIVTRIAAAGVDSITSLGSTGSYMYLTRAERARVASLTIDHAGETPVIIGIGQLRTRHVLEAADDAQHAGAAGLLLAPVSYQRLNADDVYSLFEEVTHEISVPLIVYDNPSTTHFTFSTDLYRAVCELPHVASIKIPGVPADAAEAAAHVESLREELPEGISLGVSGDQFGAAGLRAGCDAWYSVIAGTLPEPAVAITRAAQSGDHAEADRLSDRLEPLWQLFEEHGSLRVTAAAAELLGLTASPNLPRPIRGLRGEAREQVAAVLERLGL